jgi:hypothetical protein
MESAASFGSMAFVGCQAGQYGPGPALGAT